VLTRLDPVAGTVAKSGGGAESSAAQNLEKTLASGLEQTCTYMDTCGTKEGHLVIFNRDPDIPWKDKIFRRMETYQGADIKVWGM
jgi:hypothetical protein